MKTVIFPLTRTGTETKPKLTRTETGTAQNGRTGIEIKIKWYGIE